jgi:hypothetical protein
MNYAQCSRASCLLLVVLMSCSARPKKPSIIVVPQNNIASDELQLRVEVPTEIKQGKNELHWSIENITPEAITLKWWCPDGQPYNVRFYLQSVVSSATKFPCPYSTSANNVWYEPLLLPGKTIFHGATEVIVSASVGDYELISQLLAAPKVLSTNRVTIIQGEIPAGIEKRATKADIQ